MGLAVEELFELILDNPFLLPRAYALVPIHA